MADSDRLNRFVRAKLRGAGRQVEEARRAFVEAREEAIDEEPPEFNIVCRRYAEKRSVEIDEQGRPPCFDGDHPDCEGCVEDILSGRIETW